MKGLYIGIGILMLGVGSYFLATSGSNDEPAEHASTASVVNPTVASERGNGTNSASPITIASDKAVTIDWTNISGPATFIPPVSGASDPFFHIHNDPAADGFFLGIEAYTTGYGSTWTGQLGTHDVHCAADGTGICLHFDPDGPGPLGDAGADFGATGTITFNQLDVSGFDLVLSDVAFTNGYTFSGSLNISN